MLLLRTEAGIGTAMAGSSANGVPARVSRELSVSPIPTSPMALQAFAVNCVNPKDALQLRRHAALVAGSTRASTIRLMGAATRAATRHQPSWPAANTAEPSRG